MERWRPCAGGKESAPTQIHAREVSYRLLQQQDEHRRIQLSESGPALQARIQLLPDPDLHPLLYAGHCVVGLLLARSGCRSRTSVPRRDHTPHHGDPDLWDQRLSPTRVLHQGHRRLDRRLPHVRFRGAARVRASQLRVQVRHAPREHEEAAAPMRARARGVSGSGRRPPRGRCDHLRHEAAGSPPRRRAHLGEGAPVRDPHAAQEGQLLPHLAVQVPHALQADRRHLPHHVPARLRPLQPRVLVHIPVPRGERRELSCHSAGPSKLVVQRPFPCRTPGLRS